MKLRLIELTILAVINLSPATAIAVPDHTSKPKITPLAYKIKPTEHLAIAKAHIIPIPKLKPIVETVQPSGCVTGYSTSNYALNQIMAHESGGRSCATNAGGCFGLLQACPGAPLRTACGGNPECQINWFKVNKTDGRSWEQIWSLWQVQHWW